MSNYNTPFEIHVHGQVALRPEAGYEQLQEALKPLWKYAGARSLADGAISAYEEEPGIQFDAKEHTLQICWTVRGDDDFRQSLDEMCMNLNELAQEGAAIEVTFYDADFDEDEEEDDSESRDDFLMLFVGPTPAAIMQVQRDLLVQDVVNMMERHFDGAELGGVVAEIDRLFSELGETWPEFDGFVHSIGFATRESIAGDFLDGLSREAFRIAHDISAYSFPAMAKAALPRLRPGASLLTLTYLGAMRVVPNYNTMGLAKASLEASVRYLASSVGPRGIRVNGISAGPIKTLAASGITSFGKILEVVEANSPLRRNVTIDDVGNVAAFMLSDLAAGVTAEITYVDAGFSHVMGGTDAG